MQDGRAGDYRVRTVRPPGPAWKFTASLLESEEEGAEEEGKERGGAVAAAGGGGDGEGPVAYLGTETGLVIRLGYPPQPSGAGAEQAFGPQWQAPAPAPPSPVLVLAREGGLLACGTVDGRVFFLHAASGEIAAAAATIDTGLAPVTSLLWL
jgi:hypothetical protein